jgi:hypothetical protein
LRYFFSPFKANVQPFVFRGGKRDALPAQLLVRLPKLFAQQQAAFKQGPFEFGVRTSDATFPYQILLAANSTVWQHDAAPLRAGLKGDFLKLLAALESRGARPLGLALVQQALANALPLTFAESLLYRHGLDPERRSVDLQAGMRLRIEPQVRQFIGPESREQLLNGFVGSGSTTAEIAVTLDSTGARVTGFNSFLATLRPMVEGNTGGGGGVIDLQARGFARGYARLFYPPTIPGADSVGFAGFEKNVSILAADTFADLEAATALYLSQGNFEGLRNAAAATFRGRVAVTPEIQVFLDGNPVWVPVGTTFRQWVSGFTVLAPAEVPLDRIELFRSIGTLVDDANKATFYPLEAVDFEQRYLGVYSNGADCYDLPLLAGDYLRLPKI